MSLKQNIYSIYLLNDRFRLCACVSVNILKEQLQARCDLFFSFLLSVNIQTNNNG